MKSFSLQTLLLLLAIILFLLSAIDDGANDWLAFGLAILAASFLVSEAGWGRNIGGSRT